MEEEVQGLTGRRGKSHNKTEEGVASRRKEETHKGVVPKSQVKEVFRKENFSVFYFFNLDTC